MTLVLTCLISVGLGFCVGLIPQRHQSEKCEAVYYGMGQGDGVLDRRCFRLQSQLSKAAYVGDVRKIKRLLRTGANADSYAGDWLPPLYGAASRGKTQAVRLLLDNGANINRKYTLAGTPLFAAVESSHADTVALLISRGADVNIRNGDETALKIATKSGHGKIVALLKDAGAKE
jgi:ankyrin repeat protein